MEAGVEFVEQLVGEFLHPGFAFWCHINASDNHLPMAPFLDWFIGSSRVLRFGRSFIDNYKILSDKGSISAEEAKAKAEAEYDIFNKTQQIYSDFDKEIRGLFDQPE